MGEHRLQKLSSAWLDDVSNATTRRNAHSSASLSDNLAGKGSSRDSHHADSASQDGCNLSYTEWEVILDEQMSRNASRGAPETELPCFESENSSVEMAEEGQVGIGDSSKGEETQSCSGRWSCCGLSLKDMVGEWMPFAGPVSEADIATSSLVSKQVLLGLRVVLLLANALCLGILYRFQNHSSVSFRNLAIEMTPWLHVIFVLMLACTMHASLHSIMYPRIKATPFAFWTLFAISNQTLATLAQSELIRLFILSQVPWLRPADAGAGAETIFSLTSIFAIQRYTLFVSSLVVDFISNTPFRVTYISVPVLVSIAWEVALFKWRRGSGDGLGAAVAVAIGGVGLTVKSAVLSFAGYRCVLWWKQRRVAANQ